MEVPKSLDPTLLWPAATTLIWPPGLGTPICHEYGPKNQKQKNKKRVALGHLMISGNDGQDRDKEMTCFDFFLLFLCVVFPFLHLKKKKNSTQWKHGSRWRRGTISAFYSRRGKLILSYRPVGITGEELFLPRRVVLNKSLGLVPGPAGGSTVIS